MRKQTRKSTSLSQFRHHLQSLHISEGREMSSGAVSEEEIRAIMMQKAPITSRDFIDQFPGRFRSYEEKVSFVKILCGILIHGSLRKMARMQKINGINHLVFREGFSTPTSSHCVPPNGTHPSLKTDPTRSVGAFPKEEIRAVLMHKSPITTRDLVNNFPGRIRSKKLLLRFMVPEKEAFAAILKKMSRIQKIGRISYVLSRERSSNPTPTRFQSRL